MSISEREQQALASIEGDLVDSGPELAAKLAIFARLAAGEGMPPRETVWRSVRAPVVRPPANPLQVSATPDRPRMVHKLRRCAAWWLLLLVLAIAVLVVAFTFRHGSGNGVCTVSAAPVCQTHAPLAPGQSGG